MQLKLDSVYSPRHSILWTLGLAILLPLTSSGCKESAAPTVTKTASPDAGSPQQNRPVSGKVSASDLADLDPLPPGSENDPLVQVSVTPWEEILQSAKSSGKPTVVDIWSLSCEPCMREFPGLVALQKEFPEQLMCISANIDFDGRKTHPPESYLSEVNRFLQFSQARLTNHVCSTPSDDVYAAVDIDSIPAVLIFDASGNEVARYVDSGDTIGFTYEKDIIPFVKNLLSKTE